MKGGARQGLDSAVPRTSGVADVVREQAVMLGLIVFICLVFGWQEVGGVAYVPYMMVPSEIVDAWN